MDNKQLGLIVIGIILLAIMSAFIFSSKFRKDVIASEGEAAILGLINVKGVIIVLLTGIFGGIFAYIIQLDASSTSNGSTQLTVKEALDFLANSEDDTYATTKSGNVHLLKSEGYFLGEVDVELSSTESISVNKSSENTGDWNIENDNGAKLGSVNLKTEQQQLVYDRQKPKPIYYTGIPYQVKENHPLHFKIDSIYRTYPQGKTQYIIEIRFGEGNNTSSINWHQNAKKYTKTPNGRISVDDELAEFKSVLWENQYLIGLGVGQPGFEVIKGDTIFPSVEHLNMIVVKTSIE